ncbi:MAG TPA: PAS domain-containing protein, partial [Candidatus Thermoplasmatota archaeon]|nr:PAS domain-containing protein [Candidatus Thermoplasmatota archaeon]
MRRRATPRRLAIVLGLWIAYFLLVGGIDPESEVRGPTTAIPVVASGLLLGLRGGVLSAALHVPLSLLLGSGWAPEAAREGLTGWSIGLALGAGSGWMAETLGRERRQSRALAQREAQLAQAQAVAHIGSWQRNLVTGEATWSAEMWRMVGLAPQGRGPSLEEARAMVHPDDREAFRHVADPFLSRPGHFEVKHRVLGPDGTVRWVITSGTSFAGPSGKPDQWAGVSQDVTERSLAEAALQESEAQRSAVLAASPDLVFVFDRERRFTQFFAGQSGAPYVPPEVFLGKTAFEVLPPDVAPTIDAAVQRTAATGTVQEIRYSLPAADGRQEFEARLSPMPEGRVVGLARDVTSRVRAEERYRLVSEHGSDLVQQFDTKGICTYASPAARNLLGYEPAELVGNDGLWLLHPDDAAAIRTGRSGEERPDGSHLVEVRARHKNGSWVWMETISRPVRDGAGTVIGHVAASRNITVRKETESALAASEERFRQMAETSDQVFFVADAVTRRMLYVSPAYRRVTGQDPGPLYDDMPAWMEQAVPEDRPRLQASFKAFERTGAFDEEFRFVRGDGVLRWARDRLYPIRDEKGAVIRLAGIREDVTVRKEAEEEGRRREASLAQAESIAHMCSWEADLLASRTHWSAEAFVLFGLPRDTPMSYESWLDRIHPEDRDEMKAISDGVLATGQPAEFECRIVRRSDGAVRHTFNRTIPTVVDGKVVRLNGVNQDITQAKEAQLAQERLAAKEVESARLREAAEFKAQFLNNAAHELSTPLTPIKLQMASM